jgi:SAM-dependent methyltransferase
LRESHIRLLVDPLNGQPLQISRCDRREADEIIDGELREPISGATYPIAGRIPRFVQAESYAANFGFQWNRHAATQHDKHSGLGISAKRFHEVTKWGSHLPGWRVLEAGCGSGRFTTHALDTAATVVSFDVSRSVDAVAEQIGARENLLLIQADIYALPLRPHSFEGVYCFGVLQHTPRPRDSFRALCRMVAPGGRIATDVYPKTLGRYWLNTKYWVRPLTRRMRPEVLYGMTRRYVERMWPLARALRTIPRIGPTLVWRMLVADYSREFPTASEEQLKEWAVLDTFDMLSPAFDYPQTAGEFRAWHLAAGLIDVEVVRGHNGWEGRGTLPEIVGNSIS